MSLSALQVTDAAAGVDRVHERRLALEAEAGEVDERTGAEVVDETQFRGAARSRPGPSGTSR